MAKNLTPEEQEKEKALEKQLFSRLYLMGWILSAIALIAGAYAFFISSSIQLQDLSSPLETLLDTTEEGPIPLSSPPRRLNLYAIALLFFSLSCFCWIYSWRYRQRQSSS
jgi:hypothetical protein